MWEFARQVAVQDGTVSDRFREATAPAAMNALAVPDREYELAIMVYALTNNARRAQELVRDMEASGYPELGLAFRRDFDRARGWAALAAGAREEGLERLRQGVSGFACEPCGVGAMALAHDAAGSADSSLVYWERYLGLTWGLPGLEAAHRPTALRRLGEIYEARGDRVRALEHYNAFVELWKEADPALQRVVSDVRARIARLVGEGR
jgi:tetratricopeptide (TPR) repeat protein